MRRLLMVAAGTELDGNTLPVVTAPARRGIVLLRTLIDEDGRLAEIDKALRGASCAAQGAE